jgi:hypothetical protein
LIFKNNTPTPNLAGTACVLFKEDAAMLKFLIWCILFVLCWPLAVAALVFYPLVWLLLLPFRLVGIAVGGALELVWALVTLPVRVMARVL